MNALRSSTPGSATRQRATFHRILACVAVLLFLPLTMAVYTGCTAAQQAKVQAATSAVVQDATSAAGQKILADVTSGALNVGLDAAQGREASAVIAGIQGAASAIRDYEGLPTAPAASTIAKAAATGSGVATVATIVAPSLETIIGNAVKSAQTQKVGVTIDSIIEAAARGFDAVANAKVTQAGTSAAGIHYAEPSCETLIARR